MSFLDKLKDGVSRVLPDKNSSQPMSTSVSGGIGNGRGAMGFEDDVRATFSCSSPCSGSIWFHRCAALPECEEKLQLCYVMLFYLDVHGHGGSTCVHPLCSAAMDDMDCGSFVSPSIGSGSYD